MESRMFQFFKKKSPWVTTQLRLLSSAFGRRATTGTHLEKIRCHFCSSQNFDDIKRQEITGNKSFLKLCWICGASDLLKGATNMSKVGGRMLLSSTELVGCTSLFSWYASVCFAQYPDGPQCSLRTGALLTCHSDC